ncbi:hypothetical protein BVX95_02415 [archaeon D22]|nr:hypothetical protein BVX95_02415 [archaeon D22]
MKVLMFGWEFPPIKSGGLGTACKDLTKGLSNNDVEVTFVMPYVPEEVNDEHVKLVGTNRLSKDVKVKTVNTILTPYQTTSSYGEAKHSIPLGGTSQRDVYGKDIFNEVERYAELAKHIAESEEYDIIHVHDWMTYKAGMIAKEISGKPLVAHIHATEFDRTGGNPNQFISQREYDGMMAADLVIANSNFTKENVIKAYDIDPDKIEVVHWGIDEDNPHYNLQFDKESAFKKNGEKIVLFLGRVTLQKGPDYFVETARKVKDHVPEAKFVVAGNGDKLPSMIERCAELGLSNDMMFAGFLQGADVHKAFQMADLYVMPSVSEPFGLVALESLKNNTPVLLSNQSGVSEVVSHALKNDFWDTNGMADKIISALNYPALMEDLKTNSFEESKKFNLDTPAKKTIEVYNKALNSAWTSKVI